MSIGLQPWTIEGEGVGRDALGPQPPLAIAHFQYSAREICTYKAIESEALGKE